MDCLYLGRPLEEALTWSFGIPNLAFVVDPEPSHEKELDRRYKKLYMGSAIKFGLKKTDYDRITNTISRDPVSGALREIKIGYPAGYFQSDDEKAVLTIRVRSFRADGGSYFIAELSWSGVKKYNAYAICR